MLGVRRCAEAPTVVVIGGEKITDVLIKVLQILSLIKVPKKY